MKPYKEILELAKNGYEIFVAVIFKNIAQNPSNHAWLKLDLEYCKRIWGDIIKPEDYPFPCWFEVNQQEKVVYIHPTVGNL